ncbi:MAG TPA: GNAT family N-acetyltransferase [Kofleriaceae bacterium]|nr:GNAT family N-acetyltransferase [Kofleriaceae bacterium]
MQLVWHDRAFAQLSAAELYAIVRLRERVFVVEQRCIYLDADGLDPVARHLWAERAGEVVAYLRILPAGARYAELAIGRVVTAPELRGAGLGRELMHRGLAAAGPVAIRLSAQAHLEAFYRELGFRRASEVHDEDGIPHVEMVRDP